MGDGTGLAQLGLRVGGAGPGAAAGGPVAGGGASAGRCSRCASSTRSGSAIRRRWRSIARPGRASPSVASSSTRRRPGRLRSSSRARGACGAWRRSTSRAATGWRSKTRTRCWRCTRTVLDAFPDALLEDPHELARIETLIAPVRDRVSFDAPIRTPADVGATRTINVKPSRIGGLRPLFDALRVVRRQRRGDVRRRDGRARRRPRTDRAARGAVSSRRAQRRRAVGVQRELPEPCRQPLARRRAGPGFRLMARAPSFSSRALPIVTSGGGRGVPPRGWRAISARLARGQAWRRESAAASASDPPAGRWCVAPRRFNPPR